MFNFFKSLAGVGGDSNSSSSTATSSKTKTSSSTNNNNNNNAHQDRNQDYTNAASPSPARTIASYLMSGSNNNSNTSSMSNNYQKIPDELVEIDQEWSAIKSYFDAAIIGEVGVATDSTTQDEVNYALSSQLTELDAKLKRIVALVFCGGRLPSAFEKDLPLGAAVRWERIPNPTRHRTAKALLSCRQEGVSIFAVACQHAKLNLPPGSRSVLCSFMLEMLAMMEVSSNWVAIPPDPADLTPTNNDTRANNNNNNDDSSLNASLNNTYLSKNKNHLQNHTIGDVLAESKHKVCQPLVNFLAKTCSDVIHRVQFDHHEEEKNEKLYFARLLRYLCEAVAQQGERLLYTGDYSLSSAHSPNNNNNNTNNNHHNFQSSIRSLADAGHLTLPWLLETVTIFSRAAELHPVVQPTLETSLRAHLVLAVSKYDIIGGNNNNNNRNSNNNNSSSSSFVSNSDLFDNLISHLACTFVTLCRFDEDKEFSEHTAVIATIMKYLDSLYIFAPHVVDATFQVQPVATNANNNKQHSSPTTTTDDLSTKFFKFLLGTVTEMVKLTADRSFIVCMLLLSQMMESSMSVPGQSPLPTLIAQSVLCHSKEVAEAFFSRLYDNVNMNVKAAAANFLLSAVKCCPMLFVSMIAVGSNAWQPNGNNATSKNKKNNANEDNHTGISTTSNGDIATNDENNNNTFQLSSDTIGDLFPSITNPLLHDNQTIKACSLQFERARTKIIFNETRGHEEAPGIDLFLNNNSGSNQTVEDQACDDEYDKSFQKLSEYFVKNFKKCLSETLKNYTTYSPEHCAVLSGLVIEMLSLPTNNSVVEAHFQCSHNSRFNTSVRLLTPFALVAQILRDAVPSIAQHVTARLARMSERSRNVIEDIVQHSAGTMTMINRKNFGAANDDAASGSGGGSGDGNNGGSGNFMSLDDGSSNLGNNNNNNSSMDSIALVQQRVPDEFKAFAKGAVNLSQLRMEVWSVLRALEEQQRLREIDPDE